MENFTFFVWWVWLAIAVIALIAEMLIPGFVIACFSVGAVGAAVAALLGGGANVQLLTFSIISVSLLVFLRPFALKYLLKTKHQIIETNHDALPDRLGKVVREIDNYAMKGYVKIDGDEFMARSESGENIAEGTDVKVVRVDSTILIVKPIK